MLSVLKSNELTFIEKGRQSVGQGKFSISEIDARFLNLVGEGDLGAKVIDVIYPGGCRLDHAFGLWDQGKHRHGMHGGHLSNSGANFLHTSQSVKSSPLVGSVKLGVNLEGSCSKEAGGFIFIPGSHNMQAGQDAFQLYKAIGRDISLPEVCVPKLNCGDLFVFSESLMHGACPMRAGKSRLTLYYNFVPPYMRVKNDFVVPEEVQSQLGPRLHQYIEEPYLIKSESHEKGQIRRTVID